MATRRAATDENPLGVDAKLRAMVIEPGNGAAHLADSFCQRCLGQQCVFQGSQCHIVLGKRMRHRACILFGLRMPVAAVNKDKQRGGLPGCRKDIQTLRYAHPILQIVNTSR
ncbi:hypothetical protein D3C75_848630 [compost metagenome]